MSLGIHSEVGCATKQRSFQELEVLAPHPFANSIPQTWGRMSCFESWHNGRVCTFGRGGSHGSIVRTTDRKSFTLHDSDAMIVLWVPTWRILRYRSLISIVGSSLSRSNLSSTTPRKTPYPQCLSQRTRSRSWYPSALNRYRRKLHHLSDRPTPRPRLRSQSKYFPQIAKSMAFWEWTSSRPIVLLLQLTKPKFTCLSYEQCL
jgi:hypothetical protein